jgi:hypothetical protein
LSVTLAASVTTRGWLEATEPRKKDKTFYFSFFQSVSRAKTADTVNMNASPLLERLSEHEIATTTAIPKFSFDYKHFANEL